MKKLLFLFAGALSAMVVGCTQFDATDLWDEINNLKDAQEELEEEQDKMQAQIDAQQTLLNALANNLSIVSITPVTEGYVIVFSDNSTITIKHGEKGEQGEKGDSFIASITVGDDAVTFVLTDGSTIVIPLTTNGGGNDGTPQGELNKIYYTTTDGKKLFPYKSDSATFGAILISNTYDNGQGVLVFDDTITSIGKWAFYNCWRLESATIGEGVTSIGNAAFYNCESLVSVIIPDGVTSIGGGAFGGCSSLASITIPDSITSIGDDAFYECTSLASVTIGNGVTSIGEYAFYRCSSLASVTIGDGVISIGNYAFNNCTSLASITIPDSVTSIGESAFWGCLSLAEVYCKPTTPPTGAAYMFYYYNGATNVQIGCEIYVPTESVNAYKRASYWRDYSSYIVGYDFE